MSSYLKRSTESHRWSLSGGAVLWRSCGCVARVAAHVDDVDDILGGGPAARGDGW